MAGLNKYQAYPEYRDSGVESIGIIPQEWSTLKLKYIFKIQKRIAGEIGYDVLSVTQKGIKIKDIDSGEGQLSMDYSKYQRVFPGEFAMNHMDLLTGFVDISIYNGVTSPDYRVFSVQDKNAFYSRYYLYLLQDGYKQQRFFHLGQGSAHLGRWRLPTEAFNEIEYPLPSFEEQTHIVSFLDKETAKIDNLIEKQQQLIELLKEKSQAVISHAVTKGLNPDVPMKDSGVAWLGEIPEKWEIWKLSHAYEVIGSGTTPTSNNDKLYCGNIAWVTTGELRENIIYDTIKKIDTKTIESFPSLRLYPSGSVIIAMYGATIGRLGILGISATTNQACCVMTKSSVINNQYLFYWLQAFRSEIIQLSSGGGQPNINQEKVSSLKISAPSGDIQIQIVNYINSKIIQFDTLIDKQLQQIELLKERRTALISAAVTGKIDLRNWTAPIPEAETPTEASA